MLLSGKGLKHDFVQFVSATVASQVVFSLYSMVDGLMVSLGVNEYAMSAVNLAIPFTNALFSIAVLFAVGSSTLIAIAIAQDKRHEANTLFSQNFATLLILGAVATALVLLFLEPFARLLGADEITLDYVKHYLLGLAPFSVCYLVSYNLEVLVKTDGFPRYALFTVIAGCLTNCVLDYIAIFWLDMGVFGAAVATGISQLVTCISYFAHFFSKKCTFRLCKFRFDPHLYARILPIGLADGVTELCTGLMIFLFNRTVLKYIGTDGVVTYTVIAYVTSLIIQLMVGISQGSQPLVSFQYGRGDRAACRKLLRYALTTVCIAAPVLFLHVRQNNGVHKLLNKGGFSCPNRPYYTDIDIAVGTFRNIPVNAAIFHFSSPLNWTAWESEAFPWLPFFRIPNRSPAGLPPSRCSRSARCPITPRPALRNTGQGRRNYPAPGA